jgi:hypothetical protein
MALLALTVGALAIIDPDHWSRVTRLTTENVEETIEGAIDSGRTMLVRIIASEG